jgi:hypothetical protein
MIIVLIKYYCMITSKRTRCLGHVPCIAERRGACRKPKGRRPPGRPRHRLEDNIKIDLK